MLDRVTPRTELKDELVTIIRMLQDLPPAIKGDLPAPAAEEPPAEPAKSE
jgi:acetyl-CoA carboxylase carboxyl transferase subunit beta